MMKQRSFAGATEIGDKVSVLVWPPGSATRRRIQGVVTDKNYKDASTQIDHQYWVPNEQGLTVLKEENMTRNNEAPKIEVRCCFCDKKIATMNTIDEHGEIEVQCPNCEEWSVIWLSLLSEALGTPRKRVFYTNQD